MTRSRLRPKTSCLSLEQNSQYLDLGHKDISQVSSQSRLKRSSAHQSSGEIAKRSKDTLYRVCTRHEQAELSRLDVTGAAPGQCSLVHSDSAARKHTIIQITNETMCIQ